MNQELAAELRDLRTRDEETRRELFELGALFDGYAEEMERIHVENARSLEGILDRHGWPGISIAGEDGAEAAWIVAQHAISLPAFQRRCLALISELTDRGDVPLRHRAYLTDRIRFNERRPQVYGTIFDWDEEGALSPWTLESPESVDALRARAGLHPLAERTAEVRRRAEADGEGAPPDCSERQQELEEWARRVGWK